MNRLQFVEAVAKISKLGVKQVASVLLGIEEVAAAEIKEFGLVRVPGLVMIKRLDRGERLVRNPKTGEEFLMGATITVRSKPSLAFSDRIKLENPV
jgi:nucleoid DNA-binding protein